MSKAVEYLFHRSVVGLEKLDGPAVELQLACGHSTVHMPTGEEYPRQVYCKKCMQSSEKGLEKLTEALCR